MPKRFYYYFPVDAPQELWDSLNHTEEIIEGIGFLITTALSWFCRTQPALPTQPHQPNPATNLTQPSANPTWVVVSESNLILETTGHAPDAPQEDDMHRFLALLGYWLRQHRHQQWSRFLGLPTPPRNPDVSP